MITDVADINMGRSTDDLVTPAQLAGRLRMPLPTVYYHVRSGLFPSIRIGGRIRIRLSSVLNNCELAEPDLVDAEPASRFTLTGRSHDTEATPLNGSGFGRRRSYELARSQSREKVPARTQAHHCAGMLDEGMKACEMSAILRLCGSLGMVPKPISASGLASNDDIVVAFFGASQFQKEPSPATIALLRNISEVRGGHAVILVADSKSLKWMRNLPAGVPTLMIPLDNADHYITTVQRLMDNVLKSKQTSH
jgi:hypothetical protein